MCKVHLPYLDYQYNEALLAPTLRAPRRAVAPPPSFRAPKDLGGPSLADSDASALRTPLYLFLDTNQLIWLIMTESQGGGGMWTLDALIKRVEGGLLNRDEDEKVGRGFSFRNIRRLMTSNLIPPPPQVLLILTTAVLRETDALWRDIADRNHLPHAFLYDHISVMGGGGSISHTRTYISLFPMSDAPAREGRRPRHEPRRGGG